MIYILLDYEKQRILFKDLTALYDIRPFRILTWYVSIPLLQVITSVAFSKCFDAFTITIVRFKLKILKKNHLNSPKKLVSSKKFIFSNYGEYVALWFRKFFWSKNFPPSTPNIRSLKDKSVAKVYMTAFYKVNSNPESNDKHTLYM